CVRQTLGIYASEVVHQADVPGLGQEDLLVDEAPQRNQRIDRAAVAIVLEEPPHPHHGQTSTSARTWRPGSKRRRARVDASRTDRQAGSVTVAHRPAAASTTNRSSPVRSE